MANIKFILVLSLLFNLYLINCLQLKGSGYGQTAEIAKNNALIDLSSYIQVEVKSIHENMIKEVTSGNKTQTEELTQNYARAETDLPVMGATYSVKKNKPNLYYCEAKLDSITAVPIYRQQYLDLKKSIEKNWNIIKGTKDNNSKLNLLNTLLKDINIFIKCKIILTYFGENNLADMDVTEGQIKALILETQAVQDNIASAIKSTFTNIDYKNIYVYPPQINGSHDITQFANVIKDVLNANLKNRCELADARYFLRGQYEILTNGILLLYNLSDLNNNILNSFSLRLMPKAYDGLEINPKSANFEKLLYEGVVVSSDFKAEISTNKGGSDLTFKEGEEIEILVKLNKAGYYFIAGHINKPEEKLSYLVELNPNDATNRKFVQFINADDANKWISIGKFEIFPPFGMESLQLIASTKDLINNIPAFQYDDNTGYYLLSGKSIQNNVSMTRGIKPKTDNTVKVSERILIFNTFQ